MLRAITRQISPAIDRCELTQRPRQPIDLALARAQHRRYEDVLRELGCHVESLPPEPDLPDSVFVEDVAVVFDELAVITHPGAESRRPETSSVARALEPYRELSWIRPPATLDGGDVLRLGKTVYVGLSLRTNARGLEQLRESVERHGYTVQGVPVGRCLHLKSAVTAVAGDKLLLNPAFIDARAFRSREIIEVDAREPYGANALLVGDQVVCSSSYPRTHERLLKRGLPVRLLDYSELNKAEGELTCCSLIFSA
jgi:dimethylargininase